VYDARLTFGIRLAATPIAEVRAGVEAALRAEGFGVLTEIDVAATVRAKLGIERPPYLILGACNPQLSHRALGIAPDLGALLPCNVVIREDGDAVVVEAMDPNLMGGLVDEPGMAEVSSEARSRLRRAVAAVEEQFPAAG
jgi:uncharacterized protein (DUF302 family)